MAENQNSKHGIVLWRGIPAFVAALATFVLLIAFVIRTDTKAEAALTQGMDREMRLRVVERATIEMSADIRVIRVLMEKESKLRSEKP